ncbi:MAG: DNA polymerase III subunit delta [Bacteroidales bacterium]|nr:DNA polymerase III subunit delta [Bacteroidales bacterium]
MAKKSDDFQRIKTQIEQRQFAPVYLLHGEEAFFIDQLTTLLLDTVLTEDEKDFDLVQFFAGAGEFTMGDVISSCRRFPMVAEKQLVLLREAQALDKRSNKLDDLCLYLKQPSPSTILVITYKTANITGASELVKLCKKTGEVYQSDKVRDYELPRVLPGFLESLGVTAEPKAIDMLQNFIGADFSRLTHEVDKLRLSLQGRTNITAQDVADHVGISREFNVFELVEALARRDAQRVEMIRLYFARNPKAGPVPMVISTLFSFFQNMMLAFYSQDRNINGIMKEVGCSYPQAKCVVDGMRHYNARAVMRNISILREFDARSKGGRPASTPDPDLLQELFYQLTH